MPVSVRKAEIDTRNGKLIRELSNEEADSVKSQQDALKKKSSNSNTNPIGATPDIKEIYVTNVPIEFRRVELFVMGTVPTKVLLPSDDPDYDESNKPTPTPTPFTTWQEEGTTNSTKPSKDDKDKKNPALTITVMICPLSGMRATSNCPKKDRNSSRKAKNRKTSAHSTQGIRD